MSTRFRFSLYWPVSGAALDPAEAMPSLDEQRVLLTVRAGSRVAKVLRAVFGVRGFTWNTTAIVATDMPDLFEEELGRAGFRRRLLQHELAHALQWQRDGALRFLVRYVRGLARHGYSLEHPTEAEAMQWGRRLDVAAALAQQLEDHAANWRRANRHDGQA
jgi:hypothetical protein